MTTMRGNVKRREIGRKEGKQIIQSRREEREARIIAAAAKLKAAQADAEQAMTFHDVKDVEDVKNEDGEGQQDADH